MFEWLKMSAAQLGREIGEGAIDPVALTRSFLGAIDSSDQPAPTLPAACVLGSVRRMMSPPEVSRSSIPMGRLQSNAICFTLPSAAGPSAFGVGGN